MDFLECQVPKARSPQGRHPWGHWAHVLLCWEMTMPSSEQHRKYMEISTLQMEISTKNSRYPNSFLIKPFIFTMRNWWFGADSVSKLSSIHCLQIFTICHQSAGRVIWECVCHYFTHRLHWRSFELFWVQWWRICRCFSCRVHDEPYMTHLCECKGDPRTVE